MKICAVTAGLIALLFSSLLYCAEKNPDWINGKSSKYSQESYIIGIGIGDNLDASRSAARAEIAKVFKAKVIQSAQETNREKLSKGKAVNSSEVEQTTIVLTEEMLQGVEIAETWHNEKNRTYYALAVLNKQKLRAALSSQISDEEENIQSYLSRVKKTVSPIEQIRLLSGALKSWDRKEELIVKKRVVDPVAVQDLPLALTRAEIQKQKDESMDKIRFFVDSGDDKTELKEIISNAISKIGFKTILSLTDKLENNISIITVKCKIEVSDFDRGNPQWKFCNWNAYAELVDKASVSESFASISRQGQSSHINKEGAQNKAVSEASQALSESIGESINQYFFNETKK